MALALPEPAAPPWEDLARLRALLAEGGSASDVGVLLDRLTASLGPGSFPLLEAVLAERALEGQLRGLVADLEGWIAAQEAPEVEAVVARGQASPLGGLRARVLDFLWTLREDTLGNRTRLAALLGEAEPSGLNREALFAAFQLNLVLNAQARLEVRGRDSLGLAVQLWFPDGIGLDALERDLAPELAVELARRSDRACLLGGTVLRCRPEAGPACLVFLWKVAAEVGRLGDNPGALRRAIASDRLFWAAAGRPGSRSLVLSHTRWASNGVISEANCHPVADRASVVSEWVLPGVLAVLNGDVDNYQELKARYAAMGYRIDARVTTDVQIIPVVVGHFLRQTSDLAEALRLAMGEMQGSMAVVLLSLAAPGRLAVGLSGSGQALFAGSMPGGAALASEVYGVVETCRSFLRVPGVESGPEASRPGSVMEFAPGRQKPARACFLDGSPVPGALLARFDTEISTRDIDLGPHPHYLIKELSEAERSFRQTIAGKFRRDARGGLTSTLAGSSLPEGLVRRIREGEIKRILCIGQGTAAVAAEGVAALLRDRLAPARIHAEGLLASELSGFLPDEDLSDALVVAVSQSGTTTDTNRTVDVVRQRGAAVVAIVNRRNSDLVFKSDGVIYTSDGRDVEMSVASTKAFYSQVAAGQILALTLAELLGLAGAADLEREVDALAEVPGLLRGLFERREEIGAVAAGLAPRHRYWATVGNGPCKVAAREIRIKLSELCYKSIPVDITEDKKHIDLSTEPLVILCAAGLEEGLLSDVVKEAAIFKAHRATSVVITDAPRSRFAPYAAAVIEVPLARGGLSFVPVTMAGHLWGYYAARAIDEGAQLLRRIRALLVEWIALFDGQPGFGDGSAREDALREALVPLVGEYVEQLMTGRLDGGLVPSVGARLQVLLESLASGYPIPVSPFSRAAFPFADQGELLREALSEVTRGVDALLRPIDAIKHQAKTVTVGISRLESALSEPFAGALARHGIPTEQVRRPHRMLLGRLAPLLTEVAGTTLYELGDLGPAGAPREGSTIRVAGRTGSSEGLPSRADGGALLEGSKWLVAKREIIHWGRGRRDDRPVLILPLFCEGRCRRLLLMHTLCRRDPELGALVAALASFEHRLDEIRAEVTERGEPWREELLAGGPLPELFSERVQTLVDRLLEAPRV